MSVLNWVCIASFTLLVYLLDSHLLRVVFVSRRRTSNHPIEIAIPSQVLLGDFELLLGDHSIRNHIATREPIHLILRWSMTQLLDRRLAWDRVLLHLSW